MDLLLELITEYHRIETSFIRECLDCMGYGFEICDDNNKEICKLEGLKDFINTKIENLIS
jgi:hypothetical protein